MTRYWMGTASRDHVQQGVDHGFAQLCHGKASGLKRMQINDWLIYYSPRLWFEQKEPCQAFTAIGQMIDEAGYSVAISETFNPWRRAVRYVPSQDAAIKPLLNQLSFIHNQQRWGYRFRVGHFEISALDFAVIAEAMHVKM